MATLPKNVHNETEPSGPSLIRGGPFYQGQLVTHLIEADRWNLARRILFILCIAWIPLVLLTWIFQPHTIPRLLRDYQVASRLLIAVPALLLSQVAMDSGFRMIVQQVREDLLRGPDRQQLDSTIRTLIRWRDSIAPELVILALVVVNTVMIFRERIVSASPWVVYASSASAIAHLTPAGWYYTVVSQVIYQFLVGLCLWKWLLWTYFLFKLSRMNLELEASHPDRQGGLGFVGMSPLAFAPVAFAITAAIGATWRDQILRSGAHLTDFKFPALALFILLMMVAIGPLAFFSPKLATLRRQWILEYGSLAHLHSGEFHDKWIRNRSGHEQEFLSAPEISSLIDLASSFQNIEGMRTFPIEKNCLIVLVLSILLPALPTILAEIPLTVVLKDLIEAAR